MLANSKVEYSNAWWQPGATSTPFKPTSKEIQNDVVIQKQVLKIAKVVLQSSQSNFSNNVPHKQATDKKQRTRKIRKNKLALYFDATSSSDDDTCSESSSGLKIIVNSENISRKSLTNKDKKLAVEETGLIPKKEMKEKVAIGKDTENIHISSRKRSVSTLSRKDKSSHKQANEIIVEDSNKENDVCRTIPNKNCKSTNPTCPEKKIKKVETENSNHSNALTNKVQNHLDATLNMSDKKKNLSHQLFSDFKEQELIDSLDLTATTPEEVQAHYVNSSNSFDKKLKNKSISITKPGQANLKKTTVKAATLKKKQGISKQKQDSKKVFLTVDKFFKEGNPAEISEKPVNSLELPKPLAQCDKAIANIESKMSSVKQIEGFVDSSNKKESLEGAVAHTNASDGKNLVEETPTSNINQKNSEIDVLHANSYKNNICKSKEKDNIETHNALKKDKTGSSEENKVQSSSNSKIESEEIVKANEFGIGFNPVVCMFPDVQQFNDIKTFEETQNGCFTSELCSFRNFKCGIVKIKTKAHLSSKTKCDNSYIGVVVLKGLLKMKIGEKKIKIHDGGMVCIPPLTEWAALNIGKEESVFYYWSGRFKS